MNARLMFDVLLYLNVYYYPMFTVLGIMMWVAKNTSTVFPTPKIEQDAVVEVILIVSELIKILLFRKFREARQGLSIIIATSFTVISIACLLYVFIIQSPVLKLEYSLDGMLFLLLVTEVVYGIGSFLPFCKPKLVE